MHGQLIEDMLALARRLTAQAAGISMDRFGEVATRRKADNSVVTETDHAIQDQILRGVAEAFPDHAVLAEETVRCPEAHADVTRARFCWVVDPLDGTRNYASGFPCFSTSIAVLDQGWPVVALVHEHNLDHLYTAVRGGGAMMNGKPVRVDDPPPGADMLVGVPSSKDKLAVAVISDWVATPGLICRNTGSTALHLALVASGAFGAAFSKRCKIWDIAAGALLVAEAGGLVTDPFGAARLPFDLRVDSDADLPLLVGAPDAHRKLLDSIRAASTGPR